MTVFNTDNKARANGNGITLDFDFDFKIFAATNLVVYWVDQITGVGVLKILGVDYSVTINPNTEGGTVSYTVAPPTGTDSLIIRILDLTQETEIPAEAVFPEDALEDALDKLTMIVQQQQEELSRSFKFKDTSTFSNVIVEDPDDGKALIWDGGNLVNSEVNINDLDEALAQAEAAAAAAQASANAAAASATDSEDSATDAEAAQVAAEAARDAALAAVGAVKVTTADTTPKVLSEKLIAGIGINLNVLNPGLDEIYEVSSTSSGNLGAPIVITTTGYYIPSAGTVDVIVELIGGGGGAGGVAVNGGTTDFGGIFSATGGIGGGPSAPGLGGTGMGGDINAQGGSGQNSLFFTGVNYIGTGGNTALSGIARVGDNGRTPGGGSGGVQTGAANAPAGSGGGGYAKKFIPNIGTSPILVTVGLGGVNTTSGSNGIAIIWEYT